MVPDTRAWSFHKVSNNKEKHSSAQRKIKPKTARQSGIKWLFLYFLYKYWGYITQDIVTPVVAKRPGGAKDVLTNALIKLSPPCTRQNAGFFSMKSIPGGWSLGKLCAGAGGHAEVRRRGSPAASRGHSRPRSPRAACAEHRLQHQPPASLGTCSPS